MAEDQPAPSATNEPEKQNGSALSELKAQVSALLHEITAVKKLHDELLSPSQEGGKSVADELLDAKKEILELKIKVVQYEKSSREYFITLLGGKRDDGTDTPGIKGDVEAVAQHLQKLHSDIFQSSDPQQKPLSEQVAIFLEEFNKKKADLEGIRGEILSYQDALLGPLIDGKREKGIRGDVDTYVANLKSLLDTHTTAQKDLLDKIEGLLKGASTVALAKSFKEHKDAFNTDNKTWLWVFVGAIVAMMGLSVWGFIRAEYEFKEMWKYTLGNLPFLVGAVWLAIYASKQRSQNKRLQQEYAYKEDVAKVYYGLKKEIEELGDSELGKKLNEQILQVIVSTVALNPSNTLESKSHDDKGPVLAALDKVAALVKEAKGK